MASIQVGLLSVLALLLATDASPQSPLSGDALLGTWLTDEARFRVLITRCVDPPTVADDPGTEDPENEPEYCGTIVWARPFTAEEEREFSDDGEPIDPTKAIGSQILRGFVHQGDSADTDEWKEGKLYLESKDKSYSATLELRDADVLEVTVRVALLFKKTVLWTRFESESKAVPEGAPEAEAEAEAGAELGAEVG